MLDELIELRKNIILSGIIALLLLLGMMAALSKSGVFECTKTITVFKKDSTQEKFQANSGSISLNSFNSVLQFKNEQTGENVYLKDVSFTVSGECSNQ